MALDRLVQSCAQMLSAHDLPAYSPERIAQALNTGYGNSVFALLASVHAKRHDDSAYATKELLIVRAVLRHPYGQWWLERDSRAAPDSPFNHMLFLAYPAPLEAQFPFHVNIASPRMQVLLSFFSPEDCHPRGRRWDRVPRATRYKEIVRAAMQ